jgi:hypothetical protein
VPSNGGPGSGEGWGGPRRPDQRSLVRHGPESASVGRQAGAEEAHGERLEKSREGLTIGPHVEMSERERKNGRLTHGTVKALGST